METHTWSKPRTNHIGLLFFLVPTINLYLLAKHGSSLQLPLEQKSFITEALFVGTATFSVVWFLAHGLAIRESLKSRNGVLVAIFLWLFWALPGCFGLAYINQTFDKGPATKAIIRVSALRKIWFADSGRAHVGGERCEVTLEREVGGANLLILSSSYCDSIQPKTDYLEISTKPGYLKWPWREDLVIHKNYNPF